MGVGLLWLERWRRQVDSDNATNVIGMHRGKRRAGLMVVVAIGALVAQGTVAGAAGLPPGCIAHDPGESTCEFVTDGWIEAEWIHALGDSMFRIDIYAPDGSWRNSASGGGGLGPLGSVWVPAESGDRVVATVWNGALAVHGD